MSGAKPRSHVGFQSMSAPPFSARLGRSVGSITGCDDAHHCFQRVFKESARIKLRKQRGQPGSAVEPAAVSSSAQSSIGSVGFRERDALQGAEELGADSSGWKAAWRSAYL